MRLPRRFREERQSAHRVDDLRKSRELQRAYRNERFRHPQLPLR